MTVSVARSGHAWSFESQADADAFTADWDARNRPRQVEDWRAAARMEPHQHVSPWGCAVGLHESCNPSGIRPPFTHSYPAEVRCPPCAAVDSGLYPQIRVCECSCHAYVPLTTAELVEVGGFEFARRLGHAVDRAGQAGGVR